MDARDKKILAVLDENSRASYAQISKKTRIGQETVRYRVNRLLSSGTIAHLTTVLNTHVFGYSYYELFFKLKRVTTDSKQALWDYLTQHPKLAWVAECEGIFDLGIIISVKKQEELGQFMTELQKEFGQTLMKKVLAINLKGDFYARDYLLNKKRQEKTPLTYDKNSLVKLDDIDEKICQILAKNSRIPATEIGKKLGVSTDTVIQHIRKLTKENIIVGHTIVLDNTQLNQSHYKVLLKLSDTRNEQQIIEFTRRNNCVIAIIAMLADWNLEIDLEVESREQLNEYVQALTNEFADTIQDYDVLRITKVTKHNFLPS